MKPACEELKDFLPALRAILVKDLVERHKLTQIEVAKKLGITQPAVSQYLGSLRGTGQTKALLNSDDFVKAIRNVSNKIACGEMHDKQIAETYCKLCEMFRSKR